MSNLCHQIISEFLHTVITYEHELELLRRQLAENENFDIFYSFQSIDKFGKGALDSNDIKDLYDVHGIKTKKEDIEFLNKKGEAPLNITYKEFMNLLLSASSVSLREKCLGKGGSKANTPSQENDRVVEDKILELFNKKIEYAKALQVFSTYDVSPIDLRDSLFECCEESRGFLEHRKLEALMKKNNYTFDKSDFATIKRLASTFLETKISPAQFVAFMLPQADVISLNHHGVYPAEHRHTQRSHTQETFRNSHMAQIQQEIARKSSTPQPELRYSHLNVDLTSPNSNNRPSIFPSLEPEDAERAAFYAQRPHLMEKLGTSPNFKGTRKTVKFSVDEENRYNNFEESVNTRPSFGSGLQSINSNGRNQPELLIKDNPLSVNDLPSTDNRHTAGSHIFESHVKTVSNKENAVRHVRESHHGRNSQKSPPRVSHETPYSAKSQQIKDQVILREANKIKSQYDDKLAGKRELLNLSKQKRADSSVVITGHNKSPNKGNKRGIVEGVSTVDSVYFDGNRTMNMSVRNVNYTMSSKYDNTRSGKKSVSPDRKYVTFENGWKLTDYTGGNNKFGKMPSLEVARINSQNDGLTELRNLAAADEYGQKVIDDAYLNRLHYILDRKNAERDAQALKAERTVSFQPQPEAQSPYFEPNYQQDRIGDYRDYAGRRDISGFIQEIGRNSPTRKDSPSRSNSKNFMQFRDSPKRDLRLNNEVSVMSDINTLENLKIGSYRFGNNFYDRMLP